MTVSTSASGSTMTGDLPPSSSDTRFSVSVAALLMALPTSVEPVNAILSTPGCVTSAAPTRLAVAREDVDDAGRKAGFDDEVAEPQRRERRLLGRLQDARAARGERGPELPRRHDERKIPRDDLRDDADGLAARVGVDARALQAADGDVDRRAFDLRGPAGHVAEVVARARHVDDAGHLLRLAVVDALELGELVGVLVDRDRRAAKSALRAARAASSTTGRARTLRARRRRPCRRRRALASAIEATSAPVAGSITGMRSFAADGTHSPPIRSLAGRRRKAATPADGAGWAAIARLMQSPR